MKRRTWLLLALLLALTVASRCARLRAEAAEARDLANESPLIWGT